MKRSLAIAWGLLALSGALSAWTVPAFAQGAPAGAPPECGDFARLSMEAKKKADLVQAAMKAKTDRKEICTLVTNFVASEGSVIKFLEANKVWCGVPDDAIKMSKANHEKSVKFRDAACSADAAPTQKAPTLSDAIKMPSVDSATNTTTGHGTFDTLTGNPLAR